MKDQFSVSHDLVLLDYRRVVVLAAARPQVLESVLTVHQGWRCEFSHAAEFLHRLGMKENITSHHHV